MDRCQVAVVFAAAGKGERMGLGRSKALLTLAERPLLFWAAQPFIASNLVECVVVTARPEEAGSIREIVEEFLPASLPRAVITGGAERSDSVLAGLDWLAEWRGWRPEKRHLAAIHDAARPLLTLDLWLRVLEDAVATGAAIPGLPVVDTLKQTGDGGIIEATVDRSRIWQAQTPQVFEFEEIHAAYRALRLSGRAVTDDAQAMEAAGRAVRIVPGDRENIKVTTPADLALAGIILEQRRQSDGAGGTGI